jgi:hypothetical protein
VDPNFNFNNVGMAQFKNTKGELVTFSCQAGSGPKTCDVNGASTGTYTLNVDYYPKGPLNSNKTEIKSKEFTQ